MRTLRKNRIPIYYANYVGIRAVLDADGYETGEYTDGYSEPTRLYARVSGADGDATAREFGTMLDYDRLMVVGTTDITESSVLWINQKDTTKPYDYIVKRVAPDLNGTLIAIKRVNVDGTGN